MGVAVGSVGVPLSNGNFSVTGLPFEPVAVVFWNQLDVLGPVSLMYGCATSSSDQWVVWTGWGSEISAYTDRYHEGRTDRCVFSRPDPYTTVSFTASLVSMNADGFTLNLQDRTAAGSGLGNDIFYMALGGDHITEAHAGTFDIGTSTGTVSTTDPGFTPTCMLTAHLPTTPQGWDNGLQDIAYFAPGLTDGVSSYASQVVNYEFTAVTVNHIERTDAVAVAYNKFGVYTMVAEFDSWDANGFTVDVTTNTYAYGHRVGYLALNAEGAVAGNGVQPNSDTTLNYATPGLVPEGVFFCWPGVDAPSTSGSDVAPLRPGVGAGTLAQERMSSGISRSSTPFGVYTSDGYQQNDRSMAFWGVGSGIDGGNNDSQATANLVAVNLESFDLEWSDVADTNDRAFGWLALPGELVTRWIPHIYRRSEPGFGNTVTPVGAGDILLEDDDSILLEDGSGVLLLE